MGVANCCRRGKDEAYSEIVYTEVIARNERGESSSDQTKARILKFSHLKKSNFEKDKIAFENDLKDQGEFIYDKTIEEIIDEINPLANTIEIPENIKMQFSEDGLESPPIRFNSGEIYKGWWNSNTQRNGYGINVKEDGCVFKGLWDCDQIGSYGLFVDTKGNYYIGEFFEGKYQGKGKLLMKDKFCYEGEFDNEMPDGEGHLINYIEKISYNGSFKKGLKEGKGILTYQDGTKYEGDFRNDKFHGIGKLTYPDGREFEGEFKNNKIKGKGKFKWNDGTEYEGQYEDFVKQGIGKYKWKDNKYYEGEWLNDKRHGKGECYYKGKKIKGTFRFGKIIMEDNTIDDEIEDNDKIFTNKGDDERF